MKNHREFNKRNDRGTGRDRRTVDHQGIMKIEKNIKILVKI